MGSISAQVVAPPDVLARSGGEQAATFSLKKGVTVYASSGATSVFTLPAKATAVVYGTVPAVTVVNLTTNRHVVFLDPVQPTTLFIATEAAYIALEASIDLVPLYIGHLHTWRRYQPINPVSTKVYAFIEGRGIILCVDPSLASWVFPANAGLPTATNPAYDPRGINLWVPSTMCLQPAIAIDQFMQPTQEPDFYWFPNGGRAVGSSQLALSYQSPTRLWCICGTGAGATPTVLWQSNDDAASWTQMALPLLDATYQQVLGVTVDSNDQLYVSLAFGASRNHLAVLRAPVPAPASNATRTWTTLYIKNLQDTDVPSVTDPTGAMTRQIVSAQIAVDPIHPDYLCVNPCYAGPRDNMWFSQVSTNATGVSPTFLLGPYNAEAGDSGLPDTAENFVSMDGFDHEWFLFYSQTPSYQPAFYTAHDLDFTGSSDNGTLQANPLVGGLSVAGTTPACGTTRRNRESGEWITLAAFIRDQRVPRLSYTWPGPGGASDLGPGRGLAAWFKTERTGISVVRHVLYGPYFQHSGGLVDLWRVPKSGDALANVGSGQIPSDWVSTHQALALFWGMPTGGGSATCCGALLDSMSQADGASAPFSLAVAGITDAVGIPISVRSRYNSTRLLGPSAFAAPTHAPVFTSPANGAVVDNQPAVISLTWSAPADTLTHYEVQLAGDNAFSLATTMIADFFSAGTTSTTYDSLQNYTNFSMDAYARVRAMNGTAAGPWSTTLHLIVPTNTGFSTDAPLLNAPADNTHEVSNFTVSCHHSLDHTSSTFASVYRFTLFQPSTGITVTTDIHSAGSIVGWGLVLNTLLSDGFAIGTSNPITWWVQALDQFLNPGPLSLTRHFTFL